MPNEKDPKDPGPSEDTPPTSPEEKTLHDELQEEKKRLGIIDTPSPGPQKKEPGAGEPGAGGGKKTPEEGGGKPEEKKLDKEPGGGKEPLSDTGKQPKEPRLPPKYIPIPQYQEEKKEWQKQLGEKDKLLGEKDKVIEDLRKKAGEVESELDFEQFSDDLKKLDEEYGLDPAWVKALLTFARKVLGGTKPQQPPKPEEQPPKEKTPEEKEAEEKERKEQEAGHFRGEWEGFLPELKEAYPDLTEEELKDASDLMDELSHSKEWHKYDLPYVFFKNREAFDKLFKRPKSKTAEEGGLGKGTAPSEPERPDTSTMTPEKVKEHEARVFGPLTEVPGQEIQIDQEGHGKMV